MKLCFIHVNVKMAVKMLIKWYILYSVCLVGEKCNVPPWQQKTSSEGLLWADSFKWIIQKPHQAQMLFAAYYSKIPFPCLYPFCRSPVIFLLETSTDSVWIWAFIKEYLMESLSLTRFGARIVKFVTILLVWGLFCLFVHLHCFV